MTSMNREDIPGWAENHAAAAERDLREMSRNAPSHQEAFQAALALLGTTRA
jgi:hypothetical protein